jgi:enamine deaminase RidA (YjgF/YER057c/UK114 family)
VSAIEDRLAELGLALPDAPRVPAGVELPFAFVHVHAGLAHVSGHGPLDGDRVLWTGSVGAEVSPEDGYAAARATALSMLASLRRELGDLGRITGWVRALGFVRCAPGFEATPAVINGWSDLILALWGPQAGRHARSAIGAAVLPFGMPVEVEAVAAVG